MPYPVKAVVIGAGSRGSGYAGYAKDKPESLQIVGVADPRQVCRDMLAKAYDIEEKCVFEDWQAAAERDKFADCVIIATPDRLHKGPAVAFANKGYHILLEKPMAVSEEDCREIVEACKSNSVLLAVCHVLRYLPQTKHIKKLIEDGQIGDLVCIELTEPVGFWHFAHSFVRGNWRNEAESSFSLLAKSCHDLDLIHHWMSPAKCVKISSFGHLSHFTKEHKPEGAGSNCLECSIEEQCPYSAKKLYLTGNRGWPSSVVCPGQTDIESVTAALRTGPYGRCVYDCDNDVVSNQVVNFEFAGGRTATFTMIAFSEKVCERQVHVYGSHGEIEASLGGDVVLKDFVRGKKIVYNKEEDTKREQEERGSRVRGHGGADYQLIKSFVEAVATNDSTHILTGPEDTLESHLLVFAAERARKTNQVLLLPTQ